MRNLSKKRGQRVRHANPSVSFPIGISPPRKTVTGVRIVDGKPVYTFSYYGTTTPRSVIKSNGNDAGLEIALAICPKIHGKSEDMIDYVSYVKEQQGVIAREREIIATIKAMGEPTPQNMTKEWLILFTELKEVAARRNIPSKDWRPFQRRYRLPEYRTPAAIGAPAIEAQLPY